jgi:hypothetical protein
MTEESRLDQFINLSLDAVISLIKDHEALIDIGKTFQINEYVTKITEQCGVPKTSSNLKPGIRNNWCIEGVNAKVLIPGEQWQTGKVRLTIEFCPDLPEPPIEVTEPELNTSEPESENPGSLLDDIRQTLLNHE